MGLNLVFVHGAGGNHKIWEHQTEHFKNAIAIDLPGHGFGEGKRTIQGYVEDVKKICDEKGFKNIVMVGHSMGGAIAQEFALTYPEYIKALALVGTGAKLRVSPMIFEAVKKGYDHVIELIEKFAFSDKTPMGIKTKAAEEIRKMTLEVLYGDFEACDKFDILGRVSRIKVPTLIICGEDDKLTPVKYSEYLKANIQRSKLEIVSEAGHMVMLEKPKEFNKILDQFIKEIGNS